ncbi:kinesin heavy chain subunit [Rhizodiscina lignyota]|uniref:Kinesin-like protein n=1 Tax=Rhizodiscina lignyota TaxID=1504668 RepID=A0A9P4IHN9_9PEZI|nr:kinesin heavy chain subunit [Rhizodiscina lignyota]
MNLNQTTLTFVARFRPQNKVELANGGEPIVSFDAEETCSISSKEASGAFTFDRVFDMASRQSDVFDFSIRPTVDDILNGYNGTVFAYGQTGAGKSYTMMGSDIDDTEGKGVIPRIVEQIFASILSSPGNIEYTVRVSYMEIYMERIKDLLAPQNDNLPVHEEKNRGVYVKGLLEIYVSSVQEVYEVMRRGGMARAIAATNMNQESSRSHSIFVITVTQKNVETGSAKSGQLFLVDLAGSEKVGKTGASGQTLEEAKKINKSLSALGMVINSLTDGKSSHIPYRDSKLTRILQESLGGNSRTTLIINCSPSSYNDAETLSTLRFGVRAKAIKNKAKINAELSPTELKALLKKAQTQVTSFETYITDLDSEVQLWRSGESVPKEKWTPALSSDMVPTKKADARPAPGTPSTPARLKSSDAGSRSETPSRPDSRMELERASTPGLPMDKDEKEEFLRRENELQDQLAEKETALATAEKSLKEAKEELSGLKEHDVRTGKDNERLTTEINELKMQVEKINFEAKEAMITMDGLKEANSELTAELDEVKQHLLDAKMSAKETSAVLDEKEKKKAERMAQMMAGFDLGGEVFSDNERTIRKVIETVDALHEMSSSGEAIPPDDLADLRQRLLETQGLVRQAELSVNERGELDEAHITRREALEERLAAVQREYEAVLEGKLDGASVDEIKARLAEEYSNRQNGVAEMTEELKIDLAHQVEENQKLIAEVSTLQQKLKSGGPVANGVGAVNGKTVQQQIAEFDAMKKSLMRDLQNRCERVVELEISLDETREQYNNVLRTSNNRAQQKKMAFLERNLEQLTVVQRQLVEQNSSLKKEVAIAERKLIARNERIQSLESLLQDSQEKLTAANHRFEAQLTAVKERLEAAKIGSTRGLGSPTGTGFGGAFAGAGSRIAKPLRGGGAVGDVPTIPTISSLQSQEVGGGAAGKRSSWFFNQKS